MEKKHTIHEFDCGIYPQKLWVAIGVPDSVVRDLFGENTPDFGESALAQVDSVTRTKPDKKGGVLIRFKNKKEVNMDNVSHEAVHAALDIFNYIGASATYEQQEPFAYFVGWIAKMCQSCINQEREGDRVFNYTITK